MKAIVLKEFGGPDVLHWEDVSTPAPAPGEVLVKVHSVSVNRTLDLIVRQGNYPVKIQLPHVLGVDPAGMVVQVGEGVEEPKVGERVGVISLPLREAAVAHRLLEENQNLGKIILEPAVE